MRFSLSIVMPPCFPSFPICFPPYPIFIHSHSFLSVAQHDPLAYIKRSFSALLPSLILDAEPFLILILHVIFSFSILLRWVSYFFYFFECGNVVHRLFSPGIIVKLSWPTPVRSGTEYRPVYILVRPRLAISLFCLYSSYLNPIIAPIPRLRGRKIRAGRVYPPMAKVFGIV